MKTTIRLSLALLAVVSLLAGCERPPVDTVQRGYRGLGMEQVYNPRIVATKTAANQLPEPIAPVPAIPGGPTAGQVYQNVKVLGELPVAEFTRLMLAMTSWVAPQQGCAYCHDATNFASDNLYTKVVARRMIEMTRHINSDWKTHVAETGVTCFTCHRGNPVPPKVWYSADASRGSNYMGNPAGQNSPAASVAFASLPNDPFSAFLTSNPADIRVIGATALQTGNRHSIKQTEYTYGLMMHMSDALGVNCTFCHNSRSFTSWESSTPQRVTSYYGIRMAQDLNQHFLLPLAGTLPANRLGPTGDVPKANCATCHQGAFKPLYGVSLLKDYPELTAGPKAP